jgi:hypothetical protein
MLSSPVLLFLSVYLYFFFMQLFYFALENMITVVHNQGVFGHISRVRFLFDLIPSFKVQERSLYFLGVSMSSIEWDYADVHSCVLLIVVIRALALLTLVDRAAWLFLCLDCTFYFLLLRILSFDLPLQVFVSITKKVDIASI